MLCTEQTVIDLPAPTALNIKLRFQSGALVSTDVIRFSVLACFFPRLFKRALCDSQGGSDTRTT